MAIYTRFGGEVEIVVNCGKVHPRGFAAPLTLVKVRFGPGAEDRFRFAETLKADGGTQEIEAAVNALPVSKISESAMRRAIQQAM